MTSTLHMQRRAYFLGAAYVAPYTVNTLSKLRLGSKKFCAFRLPWNNNMYSMISVDLAIYGRSSSFLIWWNWPLALIIPMLISSPHWNIFALAQCLILGKVPKNPEWGEVRFRMTFGPASPPPIFLVIHLPPPFFRSSIFTPKMKLKKWLFCYSVPNLLFLGICSAQKICWVLHNNKKHNINNNTKVSLVTI